MGGGWGVVLSWVRLERIQHEGKRFPLRMDCFSFDTWKRLTHREAGHGVIIPGGVFRELVSNQLELWS